MVMAMFGIFAIVFIIILVPIILGAWKVYGKAGKPGWACIVPIYNLIIMAEIVKKPIWWGLCCLIPYVGFVFQILILIELAKSFGKSTLYGIGLVFLPFIFFPMLGFGSAQYLRANEPTPADGNILDANLTK